MRIWVLLLVQLLVQLLPILEAGLNLRLRPRLNSLVTFWLVMKLIDAGKQSRRWSTEAAMIMSFVRGVFDDNWELNNNTVYIDTYGGELGIKLYREKAQTAGARRVGAART